MQPCNNHSLIAKMISVPTFTTRSRSGFLLVEALLGIAIFGMFITAVGFTLLKGQEGSILGGDRVRAAFYAQQSLEASRAIRDGGFAALTAGAHGVALNPAGLWIYSGTQSTASGGFVTRVTASGASPLVRLSSRTSWKRGYNRSGSIVLTSDLTNWRSTTAVGNWSSVSVAGTYTSSNALFNDAVVSGNYAYVTSGIAGGGLSVLNVTTVASPTLSTSIDLGGTGLQIVLKGRTLYVVTTNASAEVRAYDITSPASPQLKTSYDLPGSAQGMSLAINGNTLFVGGIPNTASSVRALYSFDISSSGSIVLAGGMDDTGTISAVALTGTSAYLADSEDVRELTVASVTTTGALAYVGGYNLSDATVDALSIAVSGTSALLGRQKTGFQELVVFDATRSGVPSGSGPWYHEGSGSLVGVDADGNSCYGFLAAASGRKALQVVNLFDKATLSELTTYTSTSGLARGLFYDHVHDRVYLLTTSAVVILQPAGSGVGNCPS